MAEEKKPKTDYQSNSAKSKQTADDTPNRPQMQQIATAVKRKKGVGEKFKETFAGDSAESVMQYVLFDIIGPRVKDLIFEVISGGSERALFGSTSSRSSRSRSRRSQLVDKTDYRGLSEGSGRRRDRDRDRDRRERDERSRRTHEFDDIVIPTRGEADTILETLIELVDQYESATVADFYGLVGISTEHTDLKFGWTDLEDASVVPARGGGYILDLPRVEDL